MEKNLGHATAYGYAKSKGYSGTEDEFAQLMADYASVGQSAAQSAEQAAASATSATGSATTASQAAQTATSKASEAVTAAGTATTKASEANQSANTASAAATSASTSAQTATTAATTATAKASEASESATTATTAKTDAESARDAAAQSASEAAASAESIDPDEFDRKIYASFATDTASGSVASFPDGADSIPVKDVLLHVDPVQDLHGYDNPWPAGGGKNKFNVADESIVNASVTFTASNNTLTCIGIAESGYPNKIFNLTEEIPAGTHTVSFVRNDGGKTTAKIRIHYKDGTFYEMWDTQSVKLTHESPITGFQLATSNGKEYATTVSNIQIEEGSTATAYAPYSNICPITGWTAAKVKRAGKNLLQNTAQNTITKEGVTATKNADGSITLNGTATANVNFEVCGSGPQTRRPVRLNGIYTLSGCPKGGSISTYRLVAYIYKNGQYTNGAFNDVGNKYTHTVDGDSLYCIIIIYSGVTCDNLTFYPQLELGSTATDYEPYTGYDTYDITFPTEVGTVYGGTLDVTSGVLTVTDAQIASYAGETLPGEWISDRDVYVAGTTPTTGAQVVYELATPITYTLTPQEITSLLGVNNVWADTGNTEVEYRASTKMYIDKKITEAVSALS